MASLADQLLNKGVVDKKKAKKSQHQKRQTENQNRKAVKSGKTVKADGMQQQLAQAAREKQQRDLALNKERDAIQAQKALAAEVAQIVATHHVDIPKQAEHVYHFSDNNTVKKIYLTAQQQQETSQGYLAIAVIEGQYSLIPDKIAARIENRLPSAVIRVQTEQPADGKADPYADYAIPDDLMW